MGGDYSPDYDHCSCKMGQCEEKKNEAFWEGFPIPSLIVGSIHKASLNRA